MAADSFSDDRSDRSIGRSLPPIVPGHFTSKSPKTIWGSSISAVRMWCFSLSHQKKKKKKQVQISQIEKNWHFFHYFFNNLQPKALTDLSRSIMWYRKKLLQSFPATQRTLWWNRRARPSNMSNMSPRDEALSERVFFSLHLHLKVPSAWSTTLICAKYYSRIWKHCKTAHWCWCRKYPDH